MIAIDPPPLHSSGLLKMDKWVLTFPIDFTPMQAVIPLSHVWFPSYKEMGEMKGSYSVTVTVFLLFLVLIYGLLLFSLRNNIHDFSYLEMFSYGKVAVTVNSWIILQRLLRAAKLKPGLSEKLKESRISYKLKWEVLYTVWQRIMKCMISLGFGVERNTKDKILGFSKTIQCHLFKEDI